MPRREPALNRLLKELRAVAPDLEESCAVHLATIRELSALIMEMDQPPATYFQRRSEAANFVARLIEDRKAEGRAETGRSDAADRVIAAIRGGL